jgi:hypothetical protein
MWVCNSEWHKIQTATMRTAHDTEEQHHKLGTDTAELSAHGSVSSCTSTTRRVHTLARGFLTKTQLPPQMTPWAGHRW